MPASRTVFRSYVQPNVLFCDMTTWSLSLVFSIIIHMMSCRQRLSRNIHYRTLKSCYLSNDILNIVIFWISDLLFNMKMWQKLWISLYYKNLSFQHIMIIYSLNVWNWIWFKMLKCILDGQKSINNADIYCFHGHEKTYRVWQFGMDLALHWKPFSSTNVTCPFHSIGIKIIYEWPLLVWHFTSYQMSGK